MSLFEIKNVSKSFGDLKVLNDITVSVEEGEVVAIIGPSGSGKSTLLRCATMLETMDSGELTYKGEFAARNDENGKSVYASQAELRKIKGYFGLVFQQFNLFPHYSVLKNLCDAPVHVQKRNKAEVEKEALELIAKMGLEGKEKYYPQQLSGGQQQRVAIARTLVLNPDIILGDPAQQSLWEGLVCSDDCFLFSCGSLDLSSGIALKLRAQRGASSLSDHSSFLSPE